VGGFWDFGSLTRLALPFLAVAAVALIIWRFKQRRYQMAQHEAALQQQGYGGPGGFSRQDDNVGSFNNPGGAYGGGGYGQGAYGQQPYGQPYGQHQRGGMGAGTAAGMGLAGGLVGGWALSNMMDGNDYGGDYGGGDGGDFAADAGL